MTERKTVEIEYLRGAANHFLDEGSEDHQVHERKAIADFIGIALHRANRYRGYKYRDVEFDEDNNVKTFGDQTRRHYY